MADEITMTGSLTVSATNFREQFNPGTISIDLASNKGDGGVQEISHSGSAAQGEALGVTDGSVSFATLTKRTLSRSGFRFPQPFTRS